MAKKKVPDWAKRRWLEPNGDADSYIKAYILEYPGITPDSVDLKIADCNRNISLSFTKDKAGAAKAQRMLDTLNGLKAYLEEK